MAKSKTTPRDRMILKAREYTFGTYVTNFVAPEFQQMIRAEAGAKPSGSNATAILSGEAQYVYRRQGQCVCVTCGLVLPWSSGIGGMHTGHFLGSRCFSIVFEEDNVAPQCSSCNRYHSGRPELFTLWMKHVRGAEIIERLRRLKATARHFTREELVDMRIEFKRRLKEAEQVMAKGIS